MCPTYNVPNPSKIRTITIGSKNRIVHNTGILSTDTSTKSVDLNIINHTIIIGPSEYQIITECNGKKVGDTAPITLDSTTGKNSSTIITTNFDSGKLNKSNHNRIANNSE